MKKITRKNNIALPKVKELEEILKREVFRPLPKGKEDIHYPDYKTIKALIAYFEIQSDLFINDTYDIYDAVVQGDILLDKLVPKMLKTPINETLEKIYSDMYDYLSEEDEPEKSDVIFIFGGKSIERATKGLELFEKELSKKILLSGGNPIYFDKGSTPEADIYKDYLLEKGVDEKNIILEDKSMTLPDNIRRSLNLLDRINLNYKSIIIVNSPYVLRRAWAVFKKHLPDDVELYRSGCECKDDFKRENWYKKEETIRVILNEFVKLRTSEVYNTA